MLNTTTAKPRKFVLASTVVLGAAALTLAGATSAHAHVSATADTNTAGSYAIVTISVPHGCGTSPTNKVAIQIPEGITSVTPTRNAFYTAEKTVEKFDTPVTDSHGNEVTERVSEVVYTAKTPLPSDQRDTFELSLKLPESAAGETLYFPTVQTCETGESAWVEIPADGQDSHELNRPAPGIEVQESSSEHHGHGHEDSSETDESSQTPLIITSLAVGAVGLITGVTALILGRKRA